MMGESGDVTGQLVANGRLRVLHRIGSGGMAEVFAAEVVETGQRVALKYLLKRWQYDDEIKKRFAREAEIAQQKLHSPFVAHFVATGYDREERLWIAFELLEGRSLAEELRLSTSLRFSDVSWIVDHVLQGLEAAHNAGIVHRDLKPANIFVERVLEGSAREPRARILDFGISKLWSRGSASDASSHSVLTALGTPLGTPSYMPPEQLLDASDVDLRADIYAVGVSAFRSLAGKLPFGGESPAAVLQWKRDFAPLTLEDVTGRVWPPRLEAFLQRALASDREQRFGSAAEALASWREIVALDESAMAEVPSNEHAVDADGDTQVGRHEDSTTQPGHREAMLKYSDTPVT